MGDVSAPDAPSSVGAHHDTLLLPPAASLNFLRNKHLNVVLQAAASTAQ